MFKLWDQHFDDLSRSWGSVAPAIWPSHGSWRPHRLTFRSVGTQSAPNTVQDVTAGDNQDS